MKEPDLFQGITRRDYMRQTAGAAMAALSGGAPRLLAQTAKPVATADSMILLWMAGGMAQTETWDPKKYTAYESGHGKQACPEHLSLDPDRRRQHSSFARS